MSGDGYGDGSGYGYGYGDGSGDGSGYGYGDGSGDGSGYGYGYGDGDMSSVGDVIGYTVSRVVTAFGAIVKIGCEVGAVDWWRDHWREIAKAHGESVTKAQAAEVFAMIEAAE